MSNLISNDLVILDSDAKTREEVIDTIADVMDKNGYLSDKKQYLDDIFQREATATTAIGFDFATPHAKSDGVKEAVLAFMKLNNPIQWTPETEPVSMIFMIGVPKSDGDKHLDILASIFRQLVHKEFRKKLVKASSPEEIVTLVGSIK